MAEKIEQKNINLEDTFSITMELKRPLFIDEDETENEEIIKAKKIKLKNNIKIITALLLIILTIGTITWISTSYKPGEVATNALVSNNQVDVNVDKDITFTPKNEKVNKGFILYPGAKVEPEAYAPLAMEIAKNGYEVIIADMPLNFAILSPNKAEKIMNEHKNIESWVIGGHSLGGVVASKFASKESKVDGVVLLASYPSNEELKNLGKKVLSIWGSKDGVLNFTRLIESKDKLPKDTTYVEIEGANHAQFGDYGKQKGDNDALISEQKQVDITSNSIIKLLESIGNK